MKKYIPMALLFSLLLSLPVFAPAIASAGAVKGLWMDEEGEARIRVDSCGKGLLCAKIVWLRRPNDENGRPLVDDGNSDERLRRRPIIGIPVAYDMKQTHENKWQGRVYDPKRGGPSYSGYMTLMRDGRMKVTGCLAFICESEYWKPVPDSE